MAKYEFVDSDAEIPKALSVMQMCRCMAVCRLGFYHWRSRTVSPTAGPWKTLAARVQHFCE